MTIDLNNIDYGSLYAQSIFIQVAINLTITLVYKLIIKCKTKKINEMYTTYVKDYILVESYTENYIVSLLNDNSLFFILFPPLFPVVGEIFTLLIMISFVKLLISYNKYNFTLLVGELVRYDLEHIFIEHYTTINDDFTKCLSYVDKDVSNYIKNSLKRYRNPYYLMILKNFKELICLIREQEYNMKHTESANNKEVMKESISNAILKFKNFLESINNSMPNLNTDVFSDYNLFLDSIISDINRSNLKY